MFDFLKNIKEKIDNNKKWKIKEIFWRKEVYDSEKWYNFRNIFWMYISEQ